MTIELSKARLSIEQERMRFVYKVLVKYDKPQDGAKKELRRRLKGLPISLRCNGLAVTAALMASDKKISDVLIGKMLARWLLSDCPVFQDMESRVEHAIAGESRPTMRQLVAWCMVMSRSDYMAVQQEAVRMLEHAKLIAEALWPED